MSGKITQPADVMALPAESLLLHIGIHKTGTTAIQSTLRQQRGLLRANGITYPKTTDTAAVAVRSLLGREGGSGSTLPRKQRMATWQRFVEEVRPLTGRVVISAEGFCAAGDTEAAAVVSQLGAERLHIVIGVRAFGGLLPSSWQQYVKTGQSIPFAEWLREVLADPPRRLHTPTFWERNDIRGLLQRWEGLVGAERLTIVVTDPAHREIIPATFERLLGLAKGVLTRPAVQARSNRSLSAAEVELVRRVNEVTREQMSSDDYARLVRAGGTRHLVDSRAPSVDEPRIGLPSWTLPRVAEISTLQVAAIDAVHVRGATVVGDAHDLLKAPATDDSGQPGTVPIDAAAALTLGVALGAAADEARPAVVGRRQSGLRRRAGLLLPAGVRTRLRRFRA